MDSAAVSGDGARMQSRGVALVLIALGTAGFIACGSRTGLPFDEAALDPDVGSDARRLPDGAIADSIDDIPMLDASKRDANRMDCVDAGQTQIYVVTDTNDLLSFYPPTGVFKRIGVLACPTGGGFTPFSMAVDRKGVAFVLFEDQQRIRGELFRVSTATGACIPTSYVSGQHAFNSFGMGFSTNAGGPAETLFLANQDSVLGSLNTTTFNLTSIATFTPAITLAELTGTGDGRLFAFYSPAANVGDSFVGEIDKTTAAVIATNHISLALGRGWAFGFWGGDFYLFTAPSGSSIVTRYRPSDQSLTPVGAYPGVIVGAGVSTCAPQ